MFALAEIQNEQAIRSVEVLYTSLSIGILNLEGSFDPDKILIGGGISKRPDLISELQKQFKALGVAKHTEGLDTRIMLCKYLAESNMIGIVYHFELEK
ncbi:hypothetical protein IV80_GL001536 [Pediococcus cellicola]|uniref:Uncharacterized protein n=2 Tax=Pediococcus cellicola TaxID=319652 RepID=A0A0R2INM7_9LACO|nr:hypothetical protein IV80_GL001536 [Pediococcus cellicola]GEL15144.1 hypothetical protein PCE01_09460 [Pediococcus cellicola]